LGKERVIATLISTYIALAIATFWGDAIYKLFSGQQTLLGNLTITSNASTFAVKTSLFVLFIVLLTLKGGHTASLAGGSGRFISSFLTALYGFLNAGLVLSVIFNFLTPSLKESLTATSTLAEKIMVFQTWWIVLPAVILIASSILNPSSPPKTD